MCNAPLTKLTDDPTLKQRSALDINDVLRSLCGRIVTDPAGYRFAITPEPAFVMVVQPPGKPGAIGTVIRRGHAAWPTLFGLAIALLHPARQ